MIAPTAFQLVVVAGALIGAGVALLIWRLVPAQPDLRDALERLSPEHARRSGSAPPAVGDATERVGQWGMRVLPPGVWGATPTKELAILRIPVSRFYGQKVTYALLGTAIPALLTVLFNAFGASLPVYIPAGAGLVLGGVLFLLPDYNARDDAKKARAEFARALGAYFDLVALERHNGSGPRQAMEAAAAVGDSWVFASPVRGAGPHPLVRAHPLGVPAGPGRRAGPERARGPGRHHASVRGGGRPGVRLPAGPLRRHAHGDAHRREGEGQRGRRTDVHPDEPARRHLPGHLGHPCPAAGDGRHHLSTTDTKHHPHRPAGHHALTGTTKGEPLP